MTDTPDIAGGDNSVRVAATELRSFCERIERLTDEIDVIKEDIKDIKGEAKGRGYDMKAMAEMLKLRKLDKDERDSREAIRHTYGQALGIFD